MAALRPYGMGTPGLRDPARLGGRLAPRPARPARARIVRPRCSAAAGALPNPAAAPDSGAPQKGVPSWWNVDVFGREGEQKAAAPRHLRKVLALVGQLIGKVGCPPRG
jgi:hypothetical protein